MLNRIEALFLCALYIETALFCMRGGQIDGQKGDEGCALY